MSAAPVSVVIPTIGRPALLGRLLSSLRQCEPEADEILVVDQSGDVEVARTVERFQSAGARRIECDPRGLAAARNVGLQAARHELLLWVDDDCTVADTWIKAARDCFAADGDAISTGSVYPVGDPRAVPSTIVDPYPRVYRDERRFDVLYPNNMAFARGRVLELGGFDERLPGAEDNDLCYRWLSAGRTLRYEPAMKVWHHDWRTREQLVALYIRYARYQGMLYAKHLRAGDTHMLRFLARDLVDGARALASAVVYGRPRWSDPRRGVWRGLPSGFIRGLLVLAPEEGP